LGARNPRELAAVFVGGGLGALARALLATEYPATPGTWPWTTFAVNLAGAFALGYVATRLARPNITRLFWGTGVCGGLTTFSTMQLEVVQMLDAGDAALAAGYVAAALAAGYLAVIGGTALVRRPQVLA
jgi:CrcB protein